MDDRRLRRLAARSARPSLAPHQRPLEPPPEKLPPPELDELDEDDEEEDEEDEEEKLEVLELCEGACRGTTRS